MAQKIRMTEILTPNTESERRQIIVEHALAVVGLGAWKGDPASRSEFESLLGLPPIGGKWDLDRPFRTWKDEKGKLHTEGVSTCELVVRGIGFRAGVDDPSHIKPYQMGERFAEFAQRYSALKFGLFPKAGDFVITGEGLSTHLYTCVADNGLMVLGVDGGSVDDKHGYLQCIKKTWRHYSRPKTVAIVDAGLLPFRKWCYRVEPSLLDRILEGMGKVRARLFG